MANYIGDMRKLLGSQPIIMCGSVVILMNEDNHILLHHRTDNHTWGLPGGMMELGESFEQTAIRETKEETGLNCKNLQFFNVYSGKDYYYKYPNGDEVFNSTVVYTCREFNGIIKVDSSEGLDAGFFDIADIPSDISPPVMGIIAEYISRYDELAR